jgi:dolichol-phosphate mannosyltransferase
VPTVVVIPTYQEAENVVELLHRVRAALPDGDVLVVDDASPDGTAALAEEAATELGHVDVLRRPAKAGLGNAYRAGFAVALERGYDVVVQMDADLSHDPAVLPVLIEALDRADVAIGSRYVPGGSIPHWPLHRRALSRYGNRYAGLLLDSSVADATSGYRAYRADALKSIDPASTLAAGYGFQIELAYRARTLGLRIVEVPITFTDRMRGMSKMTWRIMLEELRLVTWWGVRDRVQRLRRRSLPAR